MLLGIGILYAERIVYYLQDLIQPRRNFQPQPRSPTAIATKFPMCGFQQPQRQYAGRGWGCGRSEFPNILLAELKVAVEFVVVYGQKRSNMSHKLRYLHAFQLVY